MIKNYLIGLLIATVVILGLYVGFRGYKNHKESFNKLDYKPKGTEIVVVGVHNRDMTVVNKAGDSKTVSLPRKGEAVVRIEPTGEFSIKQPSLIQMSYFLGLEYDGVSVQPSLGVQVLQWKGLGLSTQISPRGISLGVEYDLYSISSDLQNTFAGLSYRLNNDASICLLLGVYF